MDLLAYKNKLLSLFQNISFFRKKNKLNPFIKEKSSLGRFVLLRYIFKELLSYFGVCFLFLFIILFANQILLIGEQLLSQRAKFTDVALIMFYSLPAIIAQTTPFATMVGFLMCLGRMMSDNEIFVIRASGFGFKYIFIPVILLGLIISLFSFILNDYFMPLSRIKYNKLYRKIVSSTPTIVIEENSVKKIGKSIVVIGDVKEDVVSDIVFFSNEDDTDESIIIAKESKIKESTEEGVLMQLDMKDPIMFSKPYVKNSTRYDSLVSDSVIMNLFESSYINFSSKSASEMTAKDVYKRIKQEEAITAPDSLNFTINNLKMEFYKKFSIPFASISFALLAFSIAFLFGKNNGLTMGLFTGVIICVLYWAMQISGQLLVINVRANPLFCIWFPNIFFGLVGLFLSFFVVKK